MTHYDSIILSTDIEVGAESSPLWASDVVFFDSGYRAVNSRWDQGLRRLNITYRELPTAIEEIIRVFNAVNGPAHSFLVRDWGDWNTTQGDMATDSAINNITNLDQPMLNTTTLSFAGDASTVLYQLGKAYDKGLANQYRYIKKPVNGTVSIAIDGVAKVEGPDYTVDYSTGLVTFATPPGLSSSPTWGGAFYVPVAFTRDELPLSVNAFTQEVASIELLEVRL